MYANPAAARLLAAESPDALVGRSPYDFLLPEEHERSRTRKAAILTGETVPMRSEFHLARLDGTRIEIEATTVRVRWAGEKAVQVIARDVTARRRIERHLLQSEVQQRETLDYLHVVLEALGAGHYAIDLRTQKVCVSPRVRALYGLAADGPVTLDDLRRGYHPADREAVIRAATAALVPGAPPYELVHRVVDAAGIVRWVLARAIVLRDANGTAERVRGAMIDITAQRAAQEALHYNEQRMRLALDTMQAHVFEWNVATGQLQRGTGLGDLLGFGPSPDPQTATADWWFEQVHPDDREALRECTAAGVAAGAPTVEAEYRVRHHDGHYLGVRGVTRLIYGQSGKLERAVGCTVNIDTRRRAEEALREQEAQLRLVMEHSPDTIVLHDAELRYVRVINPTDGESYEQYMGKTDRDLLSKRAEAESLMAIKRRVLRENASVHCEIALTRAHGRNHYDVLYEPWRNDQGAPVGVIGYARDVTARVRVEDALRASEARYRALVENLPGGVVFVVDQDLRYVLASGEALERIDSHCTRLVGRTVREVVGAELAPHYEPYYRAALAGETVTWEQTVRGIHFLARATPLRDAHGTVTSAMAIAAEVTDMKRIERELATLEEEYRTAFELAAVGQCHMDASTGRIARVNRKYCEITGYSEDELLQTPPIDITHPEDRAADRERIERLARGEIASYRAEKRYVRKAGTVIWVDINVAAVRDSCGRLLRSVWAVQDITERRRLEQTLREADERKDEFLATLAHELRNPLAPIHTAAHLLTAKELTPAQRAQTHEMIARQAAHLTRLVDDLLDVSRRVHGHVTLKREPLDVWTKVEQAVEAVSPTIHAAGHRLILEQPTEPLTVMGDRARLVQVLTNLLTNAAKYTPPGGLIRVRAWVDRDRVLVAVEDSGIGIPRRMLSRVFEMFTQVRSPSALGNGGLGIGLALSKQLITLHGGTIEARSEGEGRGSEFRIGLPRETRVRAETPEEIATSRLPCGTGRRVLVVDDNVDAAESLKVLLELAGHRVHAVHSGTEALEALDHVRPEVILLDIGMLGLSGYEVARRARQRLGERTPLLIALTGWGQNADRDRAAVAGFDHHLTKPADPQVIGALIASAPER